MFSSKSILIVVLLALGTAGFTGAARWRHGARAEHVNQPLPILERRIASFRLNQVPAKEAFSQLQSAIGVPIKADWHAMALQHVDPDLELSCKLQDVTVGEILDGLTGELRTYDTSLAANYCVQGDSIVVAPDDCLKRTVVVYDVSDLLSRMKEEDLWGAVSFRFEPRYWSCSIVRHAQARWLHIDMNRLFIQQTSEGHRKVREMLYALRHATPEGTGPSINRLLPRRSLTEQMELCVYDMGDLADRFEYRPPKRKEWISGASAMGWYLCYSVSGPRTHATRSGEYCPVGKLLIVEEPPQDHEAIRASLRELRQRSKAPIRIDEISFPREGS